jgi:MFS family permease
LVALSVAVLVVGVDLTVLNVALPTLAGSLHASTSQLQWFVDSYSLVLAGLLLPAGLLADRYGRKRLLLVSLAVPNSGQPNAGKTLAAAATLNVQVTGVGTVPVPATASTAVLNVTVTNPTDAGFLTVFPEGETPMPTVSNLNFSSGETVANLVTVPLSATGGVTIYNSAGSTDVVADVEGYYTSTPSTNGSGLYNAISPVRVLGALSFGAPVAANTSVPVTVTGTLTGVPATATAVVANVTAEGATLPSFLTVYPAGATMPVASNLNFPAQAKNVAIANRVKIGNLRDKRHRPPRPHGRRPR